MGAGTSPCPPEALLLACLAFMVAADGRAAESAGLPRKGQWRGGAASSNGSGGCGPPEPPAGRCAESGAGTATARLASVLHAQHGGILAPMTSNPTTLRHQHNGWTQERQQRFLTHLAMHGSVTAAARVVGMSRQSAYWLKRQPHSADFARAWEEALADRGQSIEDLALDRILDGEEEVIERDGVAVRRRPADVRLLIFHLKRLEREKLKVLENQRRTPPDSSTVAKLRAEIRALAGLPPTGAPIPPGSLDDDGLPAGGPC